VGLYEAHPKPYGYAAAVDSVGTTAAPLLAGFSVTLAGLILQVDKPYETFKWPDATLALLTLAAVLLIAAVQCSFSARQYYVPPDEYYDGWAKLADAAGKRDMADLNHEHSLQRMGRWMNGIRVTYNLGVLALLAALTVLLIPAGHPTPARWVAIALAGLAWSVELVWAGAPLVRKPSKGRTGKPGPARPDPAAGTDPPAPAEAG